MRRSEEREAEREKWVPHVLNLKGDNGKEKKGSRAPRQKRTILPA